MENATQQPSPKPHNKWLHTLRRVLIFAVVLYGINLFLKLTGWDTWEKFSKKADHFAENIMIGTARLSPISLWNSIKSDEYTYETEHGNYFDIRHVTGKLSVMDKIKNWFGYYWYTESGEAFWIGRILLIFAIIVGVGIAKEDYDKARDKTGASLLFPFNALLKFFIFLLGLGIVCLLLYIVIKIFVAIGAGIVFIVSAIHAGGGFTKLLFEEAKSEAADSAKSKVLAYVLPVLFRKKK